MTAPTFRVTWDDVPQASGDFGDVFAAIAHGQRKYDDIYEPADDPDYEPHVYSWRLTEHARLWLYNGERRTAVHIDPVTVPQIDISTPVVLKQAAVTP